MNTAVRSTLHLKRERTPKHAFYLRRGSRRFTALSGDEFIQRVQVLTADHDHNAARAATLASLEALGQYLSRSQARHMTARLPRELANSTARFAGHGGPTTIKSFHAQLTARTNLAHEDVVRYAWAVTSVLRQTVPAGELSDTILKLSREFDELVA